MMRLPFTLPTLSMPAEVPKIFSGLAKRRQQADEWDKTIVAFQSPYRLKDLCLDQSLAQAEDTTRVSRQEFKVRLATNEDRRKSASMLIEKMYSWRGYETDNLNRDPNRITLVAHQENQVAGTSTLGLDSDKGLVVDELYKAEIDVLKSKLDPDQETLQKVLVRPRKGDIAVDALGLVWMPQWKDASGSMTSAWTGA